MALTIQEALFQTHVLGAQAATQGVDRNVLSTRELRKAYDNGEITRAQRDVLARALSDEGKNPTTARISQRLDTYEEQFIQADLDHNGHIDQAERKQAMQDPQAPYFGTLLDKLERLVSEKY